MVRVSTIKNKKSEIKKWAKSKRIELNKALNELLNSELKDAESMKKLIAHYKLVGIYTYSLYNTFLIKAQGGTIAQSFKRWKKLNRHVKKGERAKIYVYVPITVKLETETIDENGEIITEEKEEVRFILKPVFDISQTEGEPLKFEHNSQNKINLSYEKVKRDIEQATGLKIIETETLETARGLINNKGYIYVSAFSNDTDKIKTLIHELAHHLHGHLEEDGRDVEVKEVEAEASTYLVLTYFGIDTELSKAYVLHWRDVEHDKVIQQVKKGRILRVADKIIKMLKDTK